MASWIPCLKYNAVKGACRGPPFQSVTQKTIGKENHFRIEENWVAIIENEDRIIANSDRRFRYHCYSLENMSEEFTYQERSLYVQEDFPRNC